MSNKWRTVPLSEICDINPRLGKAGLPEDELFAFVPMAAVGAANGSIDVSAKRPFTEVKKGFTSFQSGDVLFAKITPCMENGKMAVVPNLENRYGFGSTEFHVIRPKDGIDPKYVYHYVSRSDFRKEAARHMTGAVGQKRVPTDFLKHSFIPLPPKIDDQKRIVAEIEKHFSRLDESLASLKRILANLKRYKAAVLKAAVEGKLTEKWREEHPNVEPANQLLKRILAERRAKWEAEELAKMKVKGKMPKDDSWKKKYKEPAGPDTDNLPDLPEGWVWASLGQFAWSLKDGPHYSPKYSDTGVPFISGGNVRPEGIDFSTAKYISKELHDELSLRCKPEFGDLLYTKGGTTGIARINTETIVFNVWVHVAVLKLIDSIEPFYLQHALNSSHCYKQSQQYTHGVGNQDLGLTRMVWITVPLPPLQEQKPIFEEIDHHLSVTEELEATIEINLKRAERLRQVVLKEAFSGPKHGIQKGD